MRAIQTVILVFLAALSFSCSSEPTLQEYFVDNQDNAHFLAIDVPASMFLSAGPELSSESKKTLKSIKKANVLAYPLTEETQKNYPQEKAAITKILKNDRYKLLLRMGSANRQVKISYLGEEDKIDELVAFGLDDEKGFIIARILGDEMQPKAILKLMKSAGEGNLDINIESLGQLEKVFEKEKDSIKTKNDTL
ncbi:DUF4252 domain-containing protein [Haloflavibacter putidus]|uniref:DUF4252 domain-containing protein n=1 Tax=Haloflavibacter putidus TaxID=2576776 RepID=A0A507ZPB2_9FLAO|nr:DUF4252 domain-containing protein [Haloflavibacter putidus]TQD39129.1 DUF4252 domain-containing protein [Haloflavibacter putidus]